MLYKNSNAPISDRVRDLISRMTIEEKIAQMLGVWQNKYEYFIDENGKFNKQLAKQHLQNGIGQIGRPSDTNASDIAAPDGETAREMAELTNAIQKFFVEETRLGIPVVFHEECLHGLLANEATSYPQPIGMAATFNPNLIEKVFGAIAEEARKRGAHQALTPVADIARDARWGRVEETFGEDPFLVSQMTCAAVRGLQGDLDFNNNKNLIATLKHFVAHGQPESGTNCAPVNISERELREVFLPPFKKAVQESKAASVMASYNEIDGVPSHANKWLLKDVLRKEWDFEGFVVSDYYGVKELHEREETFSHNLAHTKQEAALLAAKAGVNIELPDDEYYPELLNAVENGLIKEKEIEELIEKPLEYKFRLGLFDDPYVDPEEAARVVNKDEHEELALQAALQTVTLLKNSDSILPLAPNEEQTIAVIGPNADRLLLGGYSGQPKTYSTVLEGIKAKAGDNIRIVYSEGCKITKGGGWNIDDVTIPTKEEDEKLINRAVEVAYNADIIVLAVGGNEQTSREAWDKQHMGDRTSLDLFGRQNELVKAMKDTGRPIIALAFNGRPLSFKYLYESVDALLECWYLGQASGEAVADIIFGNYNPGGKLPISFPKSVGQIPVFYNHKPSARRGYLDDVSQPLFAFGYGLSYTNFAINNLKLENSTIAKDEAVDVSVDITNTGKYKGDEVVQLYIRDMVSSVTRPVKELKDFKRVTLEPGQKEKVSFTINPEQLSFYNIDMQYGVEPGEFKIMVGSSSREEDLLTTVLEVKD